MSPRKFDRFMVDVHIAANPKFARLTPAERWCVVGGIFSLAALAPIRGRLLIGEQRAEAVDVAHHARVTRAVASSTMTKLRTVGVIVPDDEFDCERVHDFEEWNPPPKADPTNAERQQRYRDRRAARNGETVTGVTRAGVTPITLPEVEVEVEEKSPPLPPAGGNHRKRDREKYEHSLVAFVDEHFPDFPASLVAHQAAVLRRQGAEPTVGTLRPVLEPYRPESAA